MAATSCVLMDRGNNTTCTINLHGATVVSWRVNNQEQLFVSKEAVFDGKSPINGGIHFIFPHFGDWPPHGPRHGFARIMRWSLERGPDRMASGDVEIVLSLQDNPETRSLWNYGFRLTYRLILREKELHFGANVCNTNQTESFRFSLLLSTYFKVPDVRRCHIAGLNGATVSDRLTNESWRETSEAVRITEKTDRIFTESAPEHVIGGTVAGRKMRIRKYNLCDTWVWQPWAGSRELGLEEWTNVVCVGARREVELARGTAFEGGLSLQVM